ncbi:MAG TPA: metalloregulator ArsR/SmtB family transcription factor [Acidimicrobiales bacterium]|nr:metalloregulator ArsR/SmtB family transcription factor [Acidimicrobiales bacterium]
MANDPLSQTFAALADPTRRAILVRLAKGEATVPELAEPFDVSLQAVSKHLKVLETAGLVSRGRDAQYRPCHFEPAPLEAVTDWIARNRQIWTERFDQLDQHLWRMTRDKEREP